LGKLGAKNVTPIKIYGSSKNIIVLSVIFFGLPYINVI
jgi:hypothetical protein